MKKMSKIFAALAAMTTVCSSMPAIASAEEEEINYDVFDTAYYKEYNGVDIFGSEYDNAYIRSDNSGFMLLKKVDNIINFVPADGVDYKEIFAALFDLHTEAGFRYTVSNAYGYSIKAAAYGITENDAKEVCAILKDSGLVKELVFHNDRYKTNELYFIGATSENKGNMTYYADYWWTDINELELVKEYFERNNIQNYTAEDIYLDGSDFKETMFIPDESITFEEQLTLVQNIAEELNIFPGMKNYGGGYTSEVERFEINLLDYVDGDANLDESLNLADSVAIMQSIANPDQYELTPQGKFNADIDSNGLTTGDALEIQKQLLNVK